MTGNQIQEDAREAAAGVNLPPELIFDILSLIPVKSIGRFRCVCKPWLTILSGHQFLSKHFHINNLQTTKKVIFMHNSSFVSIDFLRNNNVNGGGPPVPIYETLTFKPSSSNVKSRYMIRGSCNGLLLLLNCYEGGFELSIVNPITCESRQLPPLPGNAQIHPQSPIFGFGYCSYDDDYVVVIPLGYCQKRRVYMLKRNTWEIVGNFPLFINHDRGVFVNGAIHSLGFTRSRRMIYSFDLTAADSGFRELELPEGLRKRDNGFVLCVLGGCLCLVTRHVDLETYMCEVDVWVMKEYGVRESWTKYLASTSLMCRFRLTPLFFWNDDESIVAMNNRSLDLYCLKQNTSMLIQFVEEEGCSEKSLWTFADSLFSPNSSNQAQGNEV